jgi:hypothetical protein
LYVKLSKLQQMHIKPCGVKAANRTYFTRWPLPGSALKKLALVSGLPFAHYFTIPSKILTLLWKKLKDALAVR